MLVAAIVLTLSSYGCLSDSGVQNLQDHSIAQDNSAQSDCGAKSGFNKNCSFTHDNLERQFAYYMPENPAGALIIYLHGSGGLGAAAWNRWNALAKEENAFVIYPQGYQRRDMSGKTLNGGECCGFQTVVRSPSDETPVADVKYIKALVAWAKTQWPQIDAEQIFATGNSNGAFMTHRLACEASDVIAAFAPQNGSARIDYHTWASSPKGLNEQTCLSANTACSAIKTRGECVQKSGKENDDMACAWESAQESQGDGTSGTCVSAFVWDRTENACRRRFFYYNPEDNGAYPAIPRLIPSDGTTYPCDVETSPIMMLLGTKDLKVAYDGSTPSYGTLASRNENLRHALTMNACFDAPGARARTHDLLPKPDSTTTYSCPYNPTCGSNNNQNDCEQVDNQCAWTESGSQIGSGTCHSICDALGTCLGEGLCDTFHGDQERCNGSSNPETGKCEYKANQAYCTNCRDLTLDRYCDGDVVEVQNQNGGHCAIGQTKKGQACSVAYKEGQIVSGEELIWRFFMHH